MLEEHDVGAGYLVTVKTPSTRDSVAPMAGGNVELQWVPALAGAWMGCS